MKLNELAELIDRTLPLIQVLIIKVELELLQQRIVEQEQLLLGTEILKEMLNENE